jgi:hypothetical protein
MFGVVRSYDGTELFDNIMNNHGKFREWYNRMQEIVLSSDAKTIAAQPAPDWLRPKVFEPNVDQALTTVQDKSIDEPKTSLNPKENNDRTQLRVLATSFIALVAVFACAASSRS